MRFSRFGMALGGLILLVGCAQRTVWTKPGASQEEYRRTAAHCEFQAEAATPNVPVYGGLGMAIGYGVSQGLRVGQLHGLCMRASG